MHRLQELVRLHRLGLTERRAAKELRIGRNTAREYRRALQAAGVLDGSPDELPALEALKAIVMTALPSRPAPQQVSKLDAWQAEVEALLEKRLGPQAIYDRLRLEHADFQGSIGGLKRLVHRLRRSRGVLATDVTIPVETEPGEIAQVDFGYAGKLWDPITRMPRKAWVFVMVLGYRHQYCEVVFDQRTSTWLELHQRAFASLGGVPRVVVPDNLKAAVIRAAFGISGLPELNRSYRELARHYGFRVDPAPPRAPKKKGKVESGVKYVKNNCLRGRHDQELPAVNAELKRWVFEIAGARVHGTTGRRPLEMFTSEEQAHLLPLPKRRYETVIWKQATVHADCHVNFDKRLYSVPWRLINQEVWLRATGNSVEIMRTTYAWQRTRGVVRSSAARRTSTCRKAEQSYVTGAETIGKSVQAESARTSAAFCTRSLRFRRRAAATAGGAGDRDVPREVSDRARRCRGTSSELLRQLQLPGGEEYTDSRARPRAVADQQGEASMGGQTTLRSGPVEARQHGGRQ